MSSPSEGRSPTVNSEEINIPLWCSLRPEAVRERVIFIEVRSLYILVYEERGEGYVGVKFVHEVQMFINCIKCLRYTYDVRVNLRINGFPLFICCSLALNALAEELFVYNYNFQWKLLNTKSRSHPFFLFKKKKKTSPPSCCGAGGNWKRSTACQEVNS